MHRLKVEQGFSAIELLIALSLFAILTTIAIPSLSELSSSFDRLNARSYLIQDLKRAQAEAITKGCRGVFVLASDERSYSYGCDFLDYDISVPPSHDGQTFLRNLPGSITLSVDIPIIFNSRGQSVDVDYIISNNILTLSDGGSSFTQGTLLGTGVFDFD